MSVWSSIQSVLNARKFQKLKRGTLVTLPTGEKYQFKIKTVQRWNRSKGFRFFEHSFISSIEGGGAIETGYGEAGQKLLAIEKSIAEAFERLIFRLLRGTSYGSITTNGWAAHISRSNAKQSAIEELFERDSVLAHWFCKKPFHEIDSDTLPSWCKKWMDEELSRSVYPRLRVLVTHLGELPAAVTIMTRPDGKGVLSHATHADLGTALKKALVEITSIAQSTKKSHFFDSSKNLFEDPNCDGFQAKPIDHAMVYAYHSPFPEWMYGKMASWNQIQTDWIKSYQSFDPKKLKVNFTILTQSPLIVGRATSPMIQDVYFGRTEVADQKGKINHERLKRLNFCGAINLAPHIVP